MYEARKRLEELSNRIREDFDKRMNKKSSEKVAINADSGDGGGDDDAVSAASRQSIYERLNSVFLQAKSVTSSTTGLLVEKAFIAKDIVIEKGADLAELPAVKFIKVITTTSTSTSQHTP